MMMEKHEYHVKGKQNSVKPSFEEAMQQRNEVEAEGRVDPASVAQAANPLPDVTNRS